MRAKKDAFSVGFPLIFESKIPHAFLEESEDQRIALIQVKAVVVVIVKGKV